MPDISPYGTTQNANAEKTTAEQLVGTRAGSTIANAITGAAATFSTAPYVPPARKVIGCHGKDGMCLAHPIKGTDYCTFHTPRNREPSATS